MEKNNFWLEVKNLNFLEKMLYKCDACDHKNPTKHMTITLPEAVGNKRFKKQYYLHTNCTEEAVNKLITKEKRIQIYQ